MLIRSFFLLSLLAAQGLVASPVPPALHTQGGIRFAAVLDAPVGATLALDDVQGHELATGVTDSFGSLVFRELAPGDYQVRESGGATTPVTVLAFEDHADPSFYANQQLADGYQYITMRDGTKLAAMVRPPLGKTLADGPFPTVVEYSGYSTADPDSPQPITLLSSFLGYATVSVNLRGSGCSGGIIDLFDLPTTADGYDVIEVVAAQPWVTGKVGMVGISFSAITQLFVGGARPPHLGALAPLSTIGDIYRAPGFPGGIFNNGFAKSWLQERKNDAAPAPQGGQGWARKRARNGDQVCIANQKLRLQTLDPVEFTEAHPFYLPELMDARSPVNWVGNIDVPTFYSAAWQDEQTGPGFGILLPKFPNRPDVKITVANGVHTTPLDPEIFYEWVAFLDIYVGHRLPDPSRAAGIVSYIAQQIMGANAPAPPIPVDRYDGINSLQQAQALFEASPHVRVLMENGGGAPVPGVPAPTFELGFDRWPARQVRTVAWYLGAEGTLRKGRAGRNGGGVDAYRPDPSVRPPTSLNPGGDSWSVIPDYRWEPLVEGTALAWATAPLEKDVTVMGSGSLDLWLRTSASDTDLQATITEIRPDGLETYVQNGFLRASHRYLDPNISTVLDPWPTHLEADAAPMPPGVFTKVRVPLFPVSHVFRKGSRLRISIEAPGDDRTIWTFDTPATPGNVLNEIERTSAHRSRVVLPVVRNLLAPPELPPCPGLRGQPCRIYVPASNGG